MAKNAKSQNSVNEVAYVPVDEIGKQALNELVRATPTIVTRNASGKVVKSNKLPQGKEKSMADKIDEMTMEEVGQALEEASKPAPKKSKKAEKPAPPEFKILYSEARSCTLAQLVALDAAGVPSGKYAMREINKEHVEHLRIAYDQGQKLPPLGVVFTSLGFVVYDGYHRWNALTDGVKLACQDEDGNLDNNKYQAALATFPVDIAVKNNLTPRTLIRAAFEANYTNGLPVSNGARTRYAIWLFEDAREHGEKLSKGQAASLAQVSSNTMMMMMKRELDRQNKMAADVFTDAVDVDDYEESTISSDASEKEDKLTRDVKRLVSVARSLHQQMQDHVALHALIKEHVDKDEIAEALAFIALASRRPW